MQLTAKQSPVQCSVVPTPSYCSHCSLPVSVPFHLFLANLRFMWKRHNVHIPLPVSYNVFLEENMLSLVFIPLLVQSSVRGKLRLSFIVDFSLVQIKGQP